MRPRRRVILSTLACAIGAGAVTACDTNDGRQMQEPDPYQVFRLESTNPSTTSTTSTIAPDTTASTSTTTTSSTIPTTTSSTTTATSTTGSSDVSASSVAGGAVAASSAPPPTAAPGSTPDATSDGRPPDTFAQSIGLPDLGETGLQFTGPWEPGDAIGVDFTCDADEQAPMLTWTAPPDGTAEMALAVTDESSDPPGLVHWIVIALPAEAGSVGGQDPVVVGTEAMNSFGELAWGGPCPPDAQPHTYRFTLYALSQPIELPADSEPGDLLTAIEAASGGVTSFTGTYRRA